MEEAEKVVSRGSAQASNSLTTPNPAYDILLSYGIRDMIRKMSGAWEVAPIPPNIVIDLVDQALRVGNE